VTALPTPERALADAVYEWAEFVDSLWLSTEGEPGNRAALINFELLALELGRVMQALPAVLRAHPGIAMDSVGGRPAILVVEQRRWNGHNDDANLYVTTEGLYHEDRDGSLHEVAIDLRDRSQASPGDGDEGFGCLDRKRGDWGACPTSHRVLEALVTGPIIETIGDARPDAADMMVRALHTVERTEWLDASIGQLRNDGRSREEIVEELRAEVPFLDVGAVHDELICAEVMES